MFKTGQVAEFRDERGSHGELDAAHGLDRLDDWVQAPRLDLLMQFGLEALEPFLVFSNSPDILLEDDLLSRCGTDHFRQPA